MITFIWGDQGIYKRQLFALLKIKLPVKREQITA